jgi:hypothetical protein
VTNSSEAKADFLLSHMEAKQDASHWQMAAWVTLSIHVLETVRAVPSLP